MTNDKNSVDLEKLSSSLKVVDTANSNLNNMHISNVISEIDADLAKISFEHGNCFKDYKDNLDVLISKVDSLKSDMTELTKSLEKTINSFSDIETDTKFRKNALLNNLEEAVESSNITKIPEVVTEETAEVQENSSINTIPIGLGIAASGIAGSVGAVVVDSMVPTEKKDPIPEYEEPVEIVEKVKKPEEELDESIAREEKFDDVTPYHASRDRKVIDKFYDEEDN